MRMRRLFSFSVCIIAVLLVVSVVMAQQKPRVDGNKTKSYIEYLASDALEGRQTMTPGFQKAADWVMSKYKEWGLKPSGDEGTSYFQKVPITRSTVTWNVGIPSFSIDNRASYFDDGDFTMRSLSTVKTTVKAEVVFVGYGISAPSKGLDEYAGINVQGKVVLALMGDPNTVTLPRSGMAGDRVPEPSKIDLTEEITEQGKIRTAYDKGAVAILLYNPEPAAQAATTGGRGGGGGGRAGGGPAGFQPTRNFLAFDINERIFRSIIKKTPQESVNEYNRKLANIRWSIRNRKPQSKATGTIAALKGYEDVKMYGAQYGNFGVNVIGKIEGTDPVLKEQYIVLGGHLDHNGMRNGVIYNGADDDASGVAVVMEVARVLCEAKFQPKRTIIFSAWCGEEMGLLGSNYFGTTPPAGITMDKVVGNFNMDMVALGTTIPAPGGSNFPAIWEVIKRDQDPDVAAVLQPRIGGPGGSDHSTFVSKGIESVAIMTGGGVGHPDYHDSGDDTYKCDPEILRKVGQFVLQGTMNLANETQVNLMVPNRQYLYNGLQLRVTNINPALQGSSWRYMTVPDRTGLFEMMFMRLAQSAGSAAGTQQQIPQQFQQVQPAQARAPGGAQQGLGLPTKNVAVGVKDVKAFGGDAELAALASTFLGFGRIELSGDDSIWVANGRLTPAGRRALGTLQNNGIVIHLQNPSLALFDSVLSAATKPFFVTGLNTISREAVEKIKSKNILIGVDFDPADYNACVTKLNQLKTQLGGVGNLIVYLKSTDRLDDVKQSFYMGLIEKGWTPEEITACVGGNLSVIGGGAGGGGRGGGG